MCFPPLPIRSAGSTLEVNGISAHKHKYSTGHQSTAIRSDSPKASHEAGGRKKKKPLVRKYTALSQSTPDNLWVPREGKQPRHGTGRARPRRAPFPQKGVSVCDGRVTVPENWHLYCFRRNGVGPSLFEFVAAPGGVSCPRGYPKECRLSFFVGPIRTQLWSF